MQKIIFILATIWIFCGCQKESPKEGKETLVRLSSFQLGTEQLNEHSTFSNLRVYAYHSASREIFRQYAFSGNELQGSDLSISLPVGSYSLAFIVNGDDEDEISAAIGDDIHDVQMKLLKNGNYQQEASDFMTGTETIRLTENQAPLPLSVILQRQVGKLKVSLDKLNSRIDSLKLEFGKVPTSLTFNGKSSGSGSILKKMEYTKGSGTASAELLTFPVEAGKAEVGVLYTIDRITYRGVMKLTPAIEANRIVSVSGSYTPSESQDFNFTIQSWDGTPISGGHFELSEGDQIVIDERPVTGEPTGNNLLQNGDFESWEDTPLIPAHWNFDNSGVHQTVARITDPDIAGSANSVVLLEQETYLYQDIGITPGACYQIRLPVLSNTSAYKWKIHCSWRKTASSALAAHWNTNIQTAQQGATEGWTEAFGPDNRFRAPYEAKILRIEIRTYKPGGDPAPEGEGVYIDNFEVRLLGE